MKVKQGDKIKVEYEGRFEDGTVFDSSKNHGQPIEVEIGQKQVIPGFEKALVGMEKDQEKEVTIPAQEAYGERHEDFVKEVPKDKMPEGVKEGMILAMALPNGTQMPAKVLEVSNDNVKIDLNHPLAGKTLIFKLKVVEISS